MNQKQFEVSYVTVVFFVMVWVVIHVMTSEPEEPELFMSEYVVEDMWRFESTPADRAVILQGLTAMECIDAGLCQLTIKLPVAE